MWNYSYPGGCDPWCSRYEIAELVGRGKHANESCVGGRDLVLTSTEPINQMTIRLNPRNS